MLELGFDALLPVPPPYLKPWCLFCAALLGFIGDLLEPFKRLG